MARGMRSGEPMIRGVLIGVLMGFFVPGLVCETAASESCRIPWKVRRKVRETCWVSISAADALGEFEACIPRGVWLRWLALEDPSCIPMPQAGEWRDLRPNLFDETAGHEGKPRIRRLLLSPASRFEPEARTFAERLILGRLQWLERRRESFSARLRPVDPEGWLRSWLLGESPPTTPEPSGASEGTPTNLFFLLGYVHLLTSAGVHLLMLSLLLERLTRILGDRCGARAVVPLRRVVLVLQWMAMTWVWALSGWRWGLLRPIALIAIQQMLRGAGVRWERGVPLLAAVSIEALLALPANQDGLSGRLHYFLAVWGGVWGAAGKSGWRAHWGMAWGSWLWVAPLQLVHESWVAPLTPILSLVTIPVAGYVLLPLGILAELLPGVSFAPLLLGRLSSALMASTHPLTTLPGASWIADFRVFFGCLVLVLVLRNSGPGRALFLRRFALPVVGMLLLVTGVLRATLLLASSGFWASSGPNGRDVRAEEIIQLDVGQGDAALVTWRSTGVRRAAAVDLGSARASTPAHWIRALARRGTTRLDAVVLTHLDEDHVGALPRILDWVEVGCVVVPPELVADRSFASWRDELQLRGVRLTTRGDPCFPFPWESVSVGADSFRPSTRSGPGRLSRRSPNATMAGVLIPLESGGAYLNLGDAGFERGASELALLRLLARDRVTLWRELREGRRFIVKLGHHGSRFSTSPALLEALQPGEAWVSAGWANRYGHPHPETLARVGTVAARVRRTDRDGALVFQ